MTSCFLPSPKAALIAITRQGTLRALQLAPNWPGAVVYILPAWADIASHNTCPVQILNLPLRDNIGHLFENHNPIIFFAALGAVVRLIAPWLRSKQEDPAVLAIDEAAKFVIPVVSGHVGGANKLALAVASYINAEAIITTASDVTNTIAIDLLGHDFGWQIFASDTDKTKLAALMVNREPIAIVQEAGSRRWRDTYNPMPENISFFDSIASIDPTHFKGLLWISRFSWQNDAWTGPAAIYYPPLGQGEPLSVGIGCDRDTSMLTLRQALTTALQSHYLDITDIRFLASIDRKSDETGMLTLAKQLDLPFIWYSSAELANVATPNPSATVKRYMGTPSVAEAAALLATGNNAQLILEKYRFCGQDGKNATIAIAAKGKES